jgi:hypothetical protein
MSVRNVQMSQLSSLDLVMIVPGGSVYGTVLSRSDRVAKAMDFVMDVYRTSKAFPRDELYGAFEALVTQNGGGGAD